MAADSEQLDPTRIYSDDEKQRLNEQLLAATVDVRNGMYRDRALDRTLLAALHHRIFDGVRGHAGRHRAPGFGQETLTFGPHRSSNRKDVASELDKLFDEARRRIQATLAPLPPTSEQYVFLAIREAVYVHARVIQIHPFEDGNGRTSRLLFTHILIRLGLRGIAMEIPKGEYFKLLSAFFIGRDLNPILDRVIAMYADQL